jgi:hypothetical protein
MIGHWFARFVVFGSLMANAVAQDPDTLSPFHEVAEAERPHEAGSGPAVQFTPAPRPSLGISVSRTHEHSGMIDPAGLRRTSSAILGTIVELRDGESVGRIRDFVIGPNGAIEFLIVELDDLSYLIPYDAARIDMVDQTMTLSLTRSDFVHVPAFVGTQASLDSAEYRQRLFEATDRAELTWGLRTAAREHSAAKPIVPVEPSTQETARAPADEEAVSAVGLPVLAQPQAPTQTIIRTQTVGPPAAETPAAPAEQPVLSTPVIIGPSVGRPGLRSNVTGANQPQGVRTPSGAFAPTAPMNSRFPSVTAPRSPATSAPRSSTLGNARTVGSPTTTTTTQPQTTQPATTPPTVVTPAQIPGAGTSTTTSPSGTRYPARVP